MPRSRTSCTGCTSGSASTGASVSSRRVGLFLTVGSNGALRGGSGPLDGRGQDRSARDRRVHPPVERLERNPRLGRVVPEYRSSRLRELIVGRHRVVYWVSARDVAVLAVVDASRDLLRQLGDQPWRIK